MRLLTEAGEGEIGMVDLDFSSVSTFKVTAVKEKKNTILQPLKSTHFHSKFVKFSSLVSGLQLQTARGFTPTLLHGHVHINMLQATSG